jgi:hypothetical protein
MNSAIQNKELNGQQNLPRTEDTPQKVGSGRIAGLGTGVLLAGGAVVGCFALALWNRKALSALLRNRGQKHETPEVNSDGDSEAIY